MQESWQDISSKNPVIADFLILDRRDRSERPNRGKIIIYVRQDLNNLIASRRIFNAERFEASCSETMGVLLFVVGICPRR